MKKLLLLLFVCTAFACKKDADKTLTSNTWVIESISVSPAMTIGTKTSSNYIELMGQASCAATMMISFSNDGTYTMGSNGALCDMATVTGIRTWERSGNQIILSATKKFPMTLSGKTLSQTVTTDATGGTVYTFNYVYKAK
ncbi:hypothetical protein QWY86_13500 [Pedobacter aquatilis]|uniref:hypothetical protein n=1 Tax=Pedobacter aquatilis TaxID=351343 RepID=UPI0025B41028|nr:hypothetical protein [Pedobacter aquatilis]MDN3587692.1 hypothetical protein [Pedobacter aquatilis]